MQTEAAAAHDTAALLHEKPSKAFTKRKWSTVQLVFAVLVAVIVSNIASNMDRIVDVITKDASDSSDDAATVYKFGHEARDLFALDPDYTEFNFGAYGMKLVVVGNVERDIESLL